MTSTENENEANAETKPVWRYHALAILYTLGAAGDTARDAVLLRFDNVELREASNPTRLVAHCIDPKTKMNYTTVFNLNNVIRYTVSQMFSDKEPTPSEINRELTKLANQLD